MQWRKAGSYTTMGIMENINWNSENSQLITPHPRHKDVTPAVLSMCV